MWGTSSGRGEGSGQKAGRRSACQDTAAGDGTNPFGDNLANLAEERERADEQLESTGELPVQMRAIRHFVFGDQMAREQVTAELARVSDVMLAIATRYVAAAAPDLQGAARLARMLTEPSRLPEVRAMGHLLLAHFAFAEGRWKAAGAELTALAPFEPQWALEYRALFAAAPFLPVAAAELEAIRDALQRMDTTSPPGTGTVDCCSRSTTTCIRCCAHIFWAS